LLDATDLAEEFYDYMIAEKYSNSKAQTLTQQFAVFNSHQWNETRQSAKEFQGHAGTQPIMFALKNKLSICFNVNICLDIFFHHRTQNHVVICTLMSELQGCA